MSCGCCECESACECCGFVRKVHSKKERLEWLECYRDCLKQELAAVEEEIRDLKKK